MDAGPARGGEISQALIFMLGDGRFGIDILQVQEIRGSDRPTPIPSAPSYFRGVTDLRGEFVPVIDLRVKLGISADAGVGEGVTIILVVGAQRVGIVVDAVSEVITIDPAAVKPPPPARFAASTELVRGLFATEQGTVVLVDIDRILDSIDLKIAELVPA